MCVSAEASLCVFKPHLLALGSLKAVWFSFQPNVQANESDGMLLVFVTDRDPYVLNMRQCVFCAAEERKSSFERNKYGFQSEVIFMYLVKVMLLFIL